MAALIGASPAVAQEWAGPYAGISLGFGFGEVDVDGESSPFFGILPDGPQDISVSPSGEVTGSEDVDGALYSLSAGYLLQRGALIYGGELAVSGSDLSYTGDVVPQPGPGGGFEYEFELDYLAELRAIVGTEVSPDVMVFGSLALAYGRTDTLFSQGGTPFGGESNDRQGYSVGAGVGYRVTPGAVLTAEYIFTDLGTERYVGSPVLGPTLVDIEQDFRFSRVEVGVNFSF